MSSPTLVPNLGGQGIDTPPAGFTNNTSLAAADQNSRASAEIEVAFYNKALLAAYQALVEAYNANMQSGQNVPLDRRKAPVPPMAYEVSEPNELGFVAAVQGNTPIAPQAPDAFFAGGPKPTLDPNVTDIGDQWTGEGNQGNYKAGPLDTRPAGFKTKVQLSNGTVIILQKVKTPFGGHYEQVP
jgi:hypothetical protein